MEELLKAKDNELNQLTKVKDALRDQAKKLKEEIESLNAKIDKLENEPKEPTYPDLSEDLKEQKEENKKILEENKTLKEKIEELEKKPLSPEKLMEQLKKGMFNLGQENATLDAKVDKILKHLEKFERSEPSEKIEDNSSNLKSLEKPKIPEPEKILTRKPSDILKLKPKTDEKLSGGSKKESFGMSSSIKTIQYPKDGVIKCPHCGEQNYQEQENKKKIISYSPIKKYAKKYYCKICRGEWDYE
ncbi:MAG: hypothetical protein ACTSWX_12510 [Promethearchaeota archaeon]